MKGTELYPIYGGPLNIDPKELNRDLLPLLQAYDQAICSNGPSQQALFGLIEQIDSWVSITRPYSGVKTSWEGQAFALLNTASNAITRFLRKRVSSQRPLYKYKGRPPSYKRRDKETYTAFLDASAVCHKLRVFLADTSDELVD